MAGRKRKRCRPDPQECLNRIEQVHSRAKEKALRLLIRTLQTRPEDADDLVQSLKSAMGLASTAQVDDDADTEQKREDVDKRDEQKDPGSEASDQHNEVCDVCEKGGKLLCCDTCSLVFHLQCVRPKLEKLPKGKWSCAYCIADSVVKGDKDAAKRSVTAMKALSTRSVKQNKSATADLIDNPMDLPPPAANPAYTHDKSVVIVRSGRRYFLKEKLATLGKFDTLDQAIMAYREHTGEIPSGTVSDGEDELWCSYCLDDKSIEVCAFCGCKKCFGKHDTESLLLCDGCDSEYHIYCLDPPLSSVPGGRWFCTPCLNRQSDSDSEQSMESGVRSEVHDISSESVDEVTRDSFEPATRRDDSRVHTDSANGFRDGGLAGSNMSYSNVHRAAEESDSEDSSSHAMNEPKRIKLPADLPLVSTPYDLASVVQLSSHMSSRLLDDDELSQMNSVCSAAIPDHLHTLLDALHQQKHLILKKLDKEESLARKRAVGKDESPVASIRGDDDSSAASPGSSPSDKHAATSTSDEAGAHLVQDEQTVSTHVPKKRRSRSYSSSKAEKHNSVPEFQHSSHRMADSAHHSKHAEKTDQHASKKRTKSSLPNKDTLSGGSVRSKNSIRPSDTSRSHHAGDIVDTQKQAGSGSEGDHDSSDRGIRNGNTFNSSGVVEQVEQSTDASQGHHAVTTSAKPDGLQGVPSIPPMPLSHLTSGLTTEQMLQLMGNDMLLGHSQFHGIGSLGYGSTVLDYNRHHALAAAGLANVSMPDFSNGGTTDTNGGALTHMLRELNQRQFAAGKSLRPAQDDLLIATLAAALSGNNSHYHTPDMYSSVAQSTMRWMNEAQTPRSTSTDASTTESKNGGASKLSRKHPVKQK